VTQKGREYVGVLCTGSRWDISVSIEKHSLRGLVDSLAHHGRKKVPLESGLREKPGRTDVAGTFMPVDVSGHNYRGIHGGMVLLDVTSPRGERATPDQSHQREEVRVGTGPSASTGPAKEKDHIRTWYVLAVSSNRKYTTEQTVEMFAGACRCKHTRRLYNFLTS